MIKLRLSGRSWNIGYFEFIKNRIFSIFSLQFLFFQALNQLATLKEATPPAEDPIVTQFFSSAGVCDYLTVFLRILTAAELVKNSEFYSNFLGTEDQSISEFIKLEVEPMGKEADHVQIIALATAMGFGVTVVYMDRGDTVSEHQFPEESGGYFITLLYRPGHYDVVY